MHWKDVAPYVGAGLLFVLTQVAPSLKTFTDYLVTARMKKRERTEETVEQRADKAAEAAFADLDTAVEAIPEYARLKRAALERHELPQREAAERGRNLVLAKLESHVALLPFESRDALGSAMRILRAAQDLPQEEVGRFTWGHHPDTSRTIVAQTVAWARNVLSAYLRREAVPKASDSVEEYLKACDDLDEQSSADLAQEIGEYEEQIREFRAAHGMTPKRRDS